MIEQLYKTNFIYTWQVNGCEFVTHGTSYEDAFKTLEQIYKSAIGKEIGNKIVRCSKIEVSKKYK